MAGQRKHQQIRQSTHKKAKHTPAPVVKDEPVVEAKPVVEDTPKDFRPSLMVYDFKGLHRLKATLQTVRELSTEVQIEWRGSQSRSLND